MKSTFKIIILSNLMFYGCNRSNNSEIQTENKTSTETQKPTFDSITTIKLEAMIKTRDSIEANLTKKGKSVLSSCYEGTQNQATLTLRENHSFDIFWTGVTIPIQFFFELYEGNYTENGDTIFLNYSTQQPVGIGNKLLKTNEELIAIGKYIDSTDYRIRFFIGPCRGLN